MMNLNMFKIFPKSIMAGKEEEVYTIKILDMECNHPLLLEDIFTSILEYINITAWPKLMLLSKFHYYVIKRSLENYMRNFIANNTISRINNIFTDFFPRNKIG